MGKKCLRLEWACRMGKGTIGPPNGCKHNFLCILRVQAR
jgi:hypothetical protein